MSEWVGEWVRGWFNAVYIGEPVSEPGDVRQRETVQGLVFRGRAIRHQGGPILRRVGGQGGGADHPCG